MLRGVLLAFILFLANLSTASIRLVGSATVFHYASIISEEYGRIHDEYPIVEINGSGGGFKLLCSHKDNNNSPSIVNSSRKIRESEIKLCKDNGIEVEEIIIGFDGIVLVSGLANQLESINDKDFTGAAGKYIISDGKLIQNSNFKWNEVNKKYPNIKIDIYGPSFSSGTREILIEKTLYKLCPDFENFEKGKYLCEQLRVDSVYKEIGENANLIISKVKDNNYSLGIVGYGYVKKRNDIKIIAIDGIYPNDENIRNGSYILSRPLYMYINKTKESKNKSLLEFVKFIKEKNSDLESKLSNAGLVIEK